MFKKIILVYTHESVQLYDNNLLHVMCRETELRILIFRHIGNVVKH
jgi:hypothetical protein